MATKTKAIRVSAETHAAFKKYSDEHRVSIRRAAEIAAAGLHPFVVVGVHEIAYDVVEVYATEEHSRERTQELLGSGFNEVDGLQRPLLEEPKEFRKYGPAWKEAAGWTGQRDERTPGGPPVFESKEVKPIDVDEDGRPVFKREDVIEDADRLSAGGGTDILAMRKGI